MCIYQCIQVNTVTFQRTAEEIRIFILGNTFGKSEIVSYHISFLH